MNTDSTNDTGAAPEGERIAKVLSRAGVASRRDAERLILEGRVTVNGEQVTSPATNVTDRDRLAVDGNPVAEAEATRIWLYHKPAGLVTTEADEEGRPTVFESLPDDMPRVMSIGRLDLTSEGLLLLTNDGEIKRRLELPSTGWTRRYRVRIHGTPTKEQFQPLREGVTIEDMEYQPMEVEIDRQQGSNCWLTVTLREGKNREIRRAMEHLGFTVNRLIRVSYGPFQLGDLPVGEVEEVRAKIVRDQLGLAKPEPVARSRKKPAPEELPAFDEDAGDRPARERLATARPEGATVRRELKARAPKVRGAQEEEAPRLRAVPRTARKAVTPTAMGKARTWMRTDEARAVREEGTDEDRPRRPRAVPGETGPRSSGYKSHGRPERSDRPRAEGFRSHKAEGGDRPHRPREEGDRPPRPYKPREEGDRPARAYSPRPPRDGDDRPARPYKPREGGDRPYRPREEGDRPARPYKPREGGDRPARTFSPRPPREEGDRPSRPYKPREGGDRPYRAREEGDRPARAYKPREGGDRPARPYSPRPAREGDDRPARPYKPREGGDDRKPRSFNPSRPAREGDDRPARGFKPREGGDRPYKPRAEGDRAARPYKPREGNDRPPRGDRPAGARPPRPAGPGGPRKGPPRSGGFKPRKG